MFGSSRRKKIKYTPGIVPKAEAVGEIHNVGSRTSQQDSVGYTDCKAGLLLILADGMGGLADGDKVSQRIVKTMKDSAGELIPGRDDNLLYQLLSRVNTDINDFLGFEKQYKCGSTMLAVLIEKGRLHWVSVGDSRIYLFRSGALLQLNREHIFKSDLNIAAINGQLAFDQIEQNRQWMNISSFLGMGQLKYADGSNRPVSTVAGDRILLMSDGVFNTVSESEIASILSENLDATATAAKLEKAVTQKERRGQDNFSCLIADV